MLVTGIHFNVERITRASNRDPPSISHSKIVAVGFPRNVYLLSLLSFNRVVQDAGRKIFETMRSPREAKLSIGRVLTLEKRKCQVILRFIRLITQCYVNIFFELKTAFANNLYFYKNRVQTIRVYLLKLVCVCVCIDDKKRKIRINKVK